MTRVTVDEAAEMAVQGIFAKADRDAADRLRREGKRDAARQADEETEKRLKSLRQRI